MYGIAMMGLMTAIAAIILCWKINIHLFCKHAWQTDLTVTAISAWLFYGTFSGMATAAVAGVVFSGLLYASQLITGYR